MMAFGVAILVVLWAFHIAWIARIATDRGRSVLGWTVAGGAAGVCGLLASRAIVASLAFDGSNTSWLLATILAPLVLVLGPMALLAVALGRVAAHAARRKAWRVHSARRGNAKLTFEPDALAIAWDDGSEAVARGSIQNVAADGECVRLSWAADGTTIEHLLMPRERPD